MGMGASPVKILRGPATMEAGRFLSRPQTCGGERLDSAKANSKIMKQLYLKNQQLELQLKESGKEVNYDDILREDELKETIKQLKEDL
jgi:hypothetical protein